MALSAPMKTELTQNLKDLHLPAIRECYSEQADKARKEDLAHERYLLELTRRESESRRANRIARLLPRARPQYRGRRDHACSAHHGRRPPPAARIAWVFSAT